MSAILSFSATASAPASPSSGSISPFALRAHAGDPGSFAALLGRSRPSSDAPKDDAAQTGKRNTSAVDDDSGDADKPAQPPQGADNGVAWVASMASLSSNAVKPDPRPADSAFTRPASGSADANGAEDTRSRAIDGALARRRDDSAAAARSGEAAKTEGERGRQRTEDAAAAPAVAAAATSPADAADPPGPGSTTGAPAIDPAAAGVGAAGCPDTEQTGRGPANPDPGSGAVTGEANGASRGGIEPAPAADLLLRGGVVSIASQQDEKKDETMAFEGAGSLDGENPAGVGQPDVSAASAASAASTASAASRARNARAALEAMARSASVSAHARGESGGTGELARTDAAVGSASSPGDADPSAGAGKADGPAADSASKGHSPAGRAGHVAVEMKGNAGDASGEPPGKSPDDHSTPLPAQAREGPSSGRAEPLAGLQAGGLRESAHATHPVLLVATPVDYSTWSKDFGAHVIRLAIDGQTSAEIHLNPPELGPISVSIEMNGRDAALQFAVTHQSTQQALQSALPTLRDMFAAESLTLSSATLSSTTTSGESAQTWADGGSHDTAGQRHGPRVARDGPIAGSAGDSPRGPTVAPGIRRPEGRVDLFA